MTPLFVLGFFLWTGVTGMYEPSCLMMGLLVSLSLDHIFLMGSGWGKAFSFTFRTVKVLCKAYLESVRLVFSRSYREEYFTERIEDATPWKTFLEVFLVTLTPRTVSVNVDHADEMLIHKFEERRK